jgi:hypothetical protein
MDGIEDEHTMLIVRGWRRQEGKEGKEKRLGSGQGPPWAVEL